MTRQRGGVRLILAAILLLGMASMATADEIPFRSPTMGNVGEVQQGDIVWVRCPDGDYWPYLMREVQLSNGKTLPGGAAALPKDALVQMSWHVPTREEQNSVRDVDSVLRKGKRKQLLIADRTVYFPGK